MPVGLFSYTQTMIKSRKVGYLQKFCENRYFFTIFDSNVLPLLYSSARRKKMATVISPAQKTVSYTQSQKSSFSAVPTEVLGAISEGTVCGKL